MTGFCGGVAAAPAEARIAEVIEPAWPFGAAPAKGKAAKEASGTKAESFGKLAGFTSCTMYEIAGDPEAQSEFGNDELFAPSVNRRAKFADGVVTAHIKPLSLSLIVLE